MPARRPVLLAAGASGLAVAFAAVPVAHAAPTQAPATSGLTEDGHLAAERLAAAPLADPVTPFYGERKIYIGIKLADGSYAPPGVTAGSQFTITETPANGGPSTTTQCTTLAGAGVNDSDCPQLFGPGLPTAYVPAQQDSTITVTQTSAPGTVAADAAAQTIGPCDLTIPSPDPYACATSLVFTDTVPSPPTTTVPKRTVPAKQDLTTSIDPDTQVNRHGLLPSAVEVYGPANGSLAVVTASTSQTVTGVAPVLVDGPFHFDYTPRSGYVGADSFKYRVTTSGGRSALVTVLLSVKGARPTAKNDTASTATGSPVTVDVLGNDNANNGGKLGVSSVQKPKHGTVKIVAGKLVYTPAAGYTGKDSFTYVAGTYSGVSNPATVSVTVTP